MYRPGLLEGFVCINNVNETRDVGARGSWIYKSLYTNGVHDQSIRKNITKVTNYTLSTELETCLIMAIDYKTLANVYFDKYVFFEGFVEHNPEELMPCDSRYMITNDTWNDTYFGSFRYK